MNFSNIKSYCYLKAGPTDKVILLLHGFNSSKEEVKDYFKMLGIELEAVGISSFSPDLFHQRSELLALADQYEIVKESIQFLVNQGFKTISVCGFSLGSYLALKAAHEFKLEKVFLLSPVFSIADDLTDFLNFKIQEWLDFNKSYISYNQPYVGVISIPREFLIEIQTAKTSFDLKQGELILIAGEKDFSAENLHKIGSFQSQTVTISTYIFPKTDHIFNAFDPAREKLSEVSRLIKKHLQE